MNARLAFALCAIATAAGARAAPSADYAYAWPLQTDGDSAAWQVELNPEIYAAVERADLRDIEVLNAAGDAVPMAARSEPGFTSRETQSPLPTFALPAEAATPGGDETIRMHVQRDAGGRLRSLDAQVGGGRNGVGRTAGLARNSALGPQIDASQTQALLLDASALRQPIASVVLDWADGDANVNAQFAVDASDDLQHWRTLVDSASILHLDQGGNVLERRDIAVHSTRSPYLRLRRLDDGTVLHQMCVSARIQAVSSADTVARQWIAATSDGSDDLQLSNALAISPASKGIAWRYHLPAPLALEAARVTLADDNSLARMVLLGRSREPYEAPASWTSRGSWVAFRLQQGGATVDNGEFSLSPSTRTRDLRIETSTRLARPPSISVAYRPDRFVFLAQGAGPYRLVAGSARAVRGDYPLDAALAQLRSRFGNDWQPPLAAIGARAVLGGEQALAPERPQPPPRDWRTWILWIVLIGAAALIGGMALSLLRKSAP